MVRPPSDRSTTAAATPSDSDRGIDPGTESGEHVRSAAIAEPREVASPQGALPMPQIDESPREPRITRPMDVGPELLASARPTAPNAVVAGSEARRPQRGTMRLWSTPADGLLREVATAPDREASEAPSPKGPVSAPVVRVRAVHAIGDVDRGEAKAATPAPVIAKRDERETVPDLGTLRRYSVSTPFAIEAPHSGWRWFVGLAAVTFAASVLLMLFDGL